jgi:hypothetical protein
MIKFFILWAVITAVGVGLLSINRMQRQPIKVWAKRVAVVAVPAAILLSFVAFLEGAL